jgi:hypothetical protein
VYSSRSSDDEKNTHSKVLRTGYCGEYQLLRGWKKLHNDGFHNLYSSPNIITMIKSRRMRWIGHVRCTGEIRVG